MSETTAGSWGPARAGKPLVGERLEGKAANDNLDARVVAAAAGDRTAAGELLSELLPRVANLVRYLVGRDSDVEDITQKVLLELLRSLHTFRGESKLTTWSDRITVRVALSHMKRRRHQAAQRRAVATDLDVVPYPMDSADEYLTRRRAVRMLDKLPEEQRQVVVLHHVAGLSVPELAEMLSIPFETTRSRLRLGMKKLREDYKDER